MLAIYCNPFPWIRPQVIWSKEHR
uniref:Uncharacterized protein n=1 Tax=Arundo donax TaxID=35708 RepID=A0A0A9BJ43_ARUDO